MRLASGPAVVEIRMGVFRPWRLRHGFLHANGWHSNSTQSATTQQ